MDPATAREPGNLRVGTCGWQYAHWRGRYYPPGLPTRRWFEHYAHDFDTVEVNYTFYRLPEVETVAAWRQAAPARFRFALKLSRFVTHVKRLHDVEAAVNRFVDRVAPLGPHLGPILAQLPPNFSANPGRLDMFLRRAPSEIRWAVEFRNPGWLMDEVMAVLRSHGAALVIHDRLPDHPRTSTTDWHYLRFHGRESGPYHGTYPRQHLVAAAKRIRPLLDAGYDVHAYFNNDAGAHAIRDALDLIRYAGR